MGQLIEGIAAVAQLQQIRDRRLHTLRETVLIKRAGDRDSDRYILIDDLRTLDQDIRIRLPDLLADLPALLQKVLGGRPGLRGYDDIHGPLASRVLILDSDIEDAGDGGADVDVGIPQRHKSQLGPGAECALSGALIVLRVAAFPGDPAGTIGNRHIAQIGKCPGNLPSRNIIAGSLCLGLHRNIHG